MMKRRVVPTLGIAAVIALLLLAFTPRNQDDYYFKLNRGLELFGQVYREIADSYVDEIDPEEFINAGIQGMLQTLDPYTVYMRQKESADIDLLTSGYYGGIGITVGMRDSAITVVDVVDGYSAQHEGVRIGDRIMSINGVDVSQLPVDSLRGYTRGDPGTTLTMSVAREGSASPLTFTLTRENIRVRSVTYSGVVGGNIGYIKLERFGNTAGDEVRRALADLLANGATGIILDLRDNPGGLLEAAVEVASAIVPEGSTIVTTRGRDSSEQRVYRSTDTPILGDAPLVVLVNSNSASAAEIVAGAVQDLDAGVILGSPTFGKGLVQSIRRLPHEGTLKLTTARYYTPSGRCIQKVEYASEAHLKPLETSTFRTASFKTQRGRLVTAAGGVIPDSTVRELDTASLLSRILQSETFFDFATRYAAGMRTLPEDFHLSDQDMQRFETEVVRAFASSESQNPLIAETRALMRNAQASGYGGDVLRSIRTLESQVAGDVGRAVAASRQELRRELEAEVIGRLRGQRERVATLLGTDPHVSTAIGLVRAGHRDYNRLLSAR